jgi:hypothetical protein
LSGPEDDPRIGAADPVADRDLTAELAAGRQRLLADIDRRGTRSRRRVAAAVAGAAAVLLAAMALLPSLGGDRSSGLPAPVQAFADQLEGDGILHVVVEQRTIPGRGGAPTPSPPIRTAGWFDLDSRRWRTRVEQSPGDTIVEDVSDGQHVTGYVIQGEDVRAERLDFEAMPPEYRRGQMPVWLPELRSALEAGTAHVAGDATVGGRPAFVVSIDVGRTDEHAVRLSVYVARDDHAMLRIDQRIWVEPRRAWLRSSQEVLTYEVLPPTAANRRMLEPAVRPAARD